ncbi:MAG: cell surface protein [Lactobacillus sp.]|nr:cell surface protein [Lactobacillus sp.]
MFKKFSITILLLILFISNTGFVVVGHRGDPIKAPEESFQSIDTAIGEGAQWVELDVHESNDNQLVISHDRNLFRVTGQNVIVSEHSASQLTQLKQSNGQSIYTLDELFAHYQKEPNVKFLIETKKNKHGNPQNMELLLVNAIKKYQMQNRVMVHSFSLASLKNLQELMPEIPRIFIAGSLGRLDFEVFQYSNAVNVSSSLLNPQLINQLHAIGQQVYVWDEMNENPKQWNWLVNLPIDGVVTNFPATAAYYQRLTQHSQQDDANFDAVYYNEQAAPLWENPYPQAPQKGMLSPLTTVHVQKIVNVQNQVFFQIDANRFINMSGLVQTDLIHNLAPFWQQKAVLKNTLVTRTLWDNPSANHNKIGTLLFNQVYHITALQNVNGQSYAQLNNFGWTNLNNLLINACPEPQQLTPQIEKKRAPAQNNISLQLNLRAWLPQPKTKANPISLLPAVTYPQQILPNLDDIDHYFPLQH